LKPAVAAALRSAIVDVTGLAGAACAVRGAALLHEAAAWLLAGALCLSFWIWIVTPWRRE
jgi:hypothetical protein